MGLKTKNIIATAAIIAVMVLSCTSPEPETGQLKENKGPRETSEVPSVERCLTFAEMQLFKTVDTFFQSNIPQSPTVVTWPAGDKRFPRFIQEDGTWSMTDSCAWSSGFFAGCLWLMYEHTGDKQWEQVARIWTENLEQEKLATGDHNNGFKMLPSYGNGYRLTGDERYREVLVESARSLATRYSEKVGHIKANEAEQWQFPVLIDTMVNIELLFWASRNGGESSWFDMAVTHALNTIEHHIRADGSTIQLVDCNPETGEVIGNDTLCGLSGESAWSRGQGQALYGFITAYRYTEDPRFLAAAQKVADFLIDHLPADGIPYWDVSDPALPNIMRDASAASVATVGLLELCEKAADAEARQKYRTTSVTMIASLCSSAYLADNTKSAGIITHATWKKPTDPQSDTSLIWGDYYFLEAVLRLNHGIR